VNVTGEARHDHAPLGSLEEKSSQSATDGTLGSGEAGSSALVESQSNNATPSSPMAASLDTSVRRLSMGVRSSLKSPECTTMPTLV